MSEAWLEVAGLKPNTPPILALTKEIQAVKVGLQEDILKAVAQGLAGIHGGVGIPKTALPQMQSLPPVLFTDHGMADFAMISPPRASKHTSERPIADLEPEEDDDDFYMSSNVTAAPTTDVSDPRGDTEPEERSESDKNYVPGKSVTSGVVKNFRFRSSKKVQFHSVIQPSSDSEDNLPGLRHDPNPFVIRSASSFQTSPVLSGTSAFSLALAGPSQTQTSSKDKMILDQSFSSSISE